MECAKRVTLLIVIAILQLTGCLAISAITTGSESATALSSSSLSKLKMVVLHDQKLLQRISVETGKFSVSSSFRVIPVVLKDINVPDMGLHIFSEPTRGVYSKEHLKPGIR